MSLPVYFAFLLACAVVMIGPSPTLTLIVAGRPRHGRRADMLNAARIQLGLAFTAGVVLLGLASLIAGDGRLVCAGAPRRCRRVVKLPGVSAFHFHRSACRACNRPLKRLVIMFSNRKKPLN